MATVLYEKAGNDPFSPSIQANNIIVDNDVNGDNGIIVNFTISSKQDALDNWVKDIDYLQYMIIGFYVLNSTSQVDELKEILQTYNPEGIQKFEQDYDGLIKVVKIPLRDIVDISETTENNSTFTTEYSKTFESLSDDITLMVIPNIDFDSYFSDYGLDSELVSSLIESFYNYEYYQYNILQNNDTLQDNTNSKILNDVRQISELKNNLFSLLPLSLDIAPFEVDNVNYFSDVFSSFNYETKIIKNYFFFNIANFIKENSALKKVFKNFTKEQIDSTLINNKSIFFEIIKTNKYDDEDTKSICSFNCSLSKVFQVLGSTVAIVNSVSTQDLICISFIDDFVGIKKSSFYYTINVSFFDPFIKLCYDVSNIPSTGFYFNVLNNLTILESYVYDPRNSNSTTTRFEPLTFEFAPTLQKNDMIFYFFGIYNLFVNKEVTQERIDKISKALEFNSANIITYNDFFSFINKCMTQFENYFVSYFLTQNSYSIKSSIKKIDVKDFYFSKDSADYKMIKFYNENNKNQIATYDITSGTLDTTNPVTYKIINSVLTLVNDQNSYSPDVSYIDNLIEAEGTTIELYDNFIKNKKLNSTVELFAQACSTNSAFEKPSSRAIDILNANQQYSFSYEKTVSNSIRNKVTNAQKSADNTEYETIMKFYLYFLNDMNNEFLTPKITTLIYDSKNKQWTNINSINLRRNIGKSYLAKTIYNIEKQKDIFSYNKIIPLINEEYFILQISATPTVGLV